MINKFIVEVKRYAIIVYTEDDLSNVHYRAVVDGFEYAYQIIPSRMTFSKPDNDWFLRGGNEVRYHANNAGENIRWLTVTPEFKCRAMAKNRLENESWHARLKNM